MAKGSAVERLYRDIKVELTNRTHLPGKRIDVAGLCERYSVSPTPMRNVLNRLVGEKIVETQSHDGFYIPRITEESLRGLIAWSEHLLLVAMDALSDPDQVLPLPEPEDDVVAATETLFAELAALSPNAEIGMAVAGVNDRLRSVRRLPDAAAIDSPGELRAFREAWQTSNLAGLRQLVLDYHATRQKALSQIIALAYTAPVRLPRSGRPAS